jgi:hypothetical protein
MTPTCSTLVSDVAAARVRVASWACFHARNKLPSRMAGILETILLTDIARTQAMLGSPPAGWDMAEYTKWRDSFGVARDVWNGKDFNGHNGLGIEAMVGSTLSLEAAISDDGTCIDEANEPHAIAVAHAMLESLFEGRTSAHPDAVELPRRGRVLDLADRPVTVHALCDLSRVALLDRLARVCATVGPEVARAFVVSEFSAAAPPPSS